MQLMMCWLGGPWFQPSCANEAFLLGYCTTFPLVLFTNDLIVENMGMYSVELQDVLMRLGGTAERRCASVDQRLGSFAACGVVFYGLGKSTQDAFHCTS